MTRATEPNNAPLAGVAFDWFGEEGRQAIEAELRRRYADILAPVKPPAANDNGKH